jgi:hypothetical protein
VGLPDQVRTPYKGDTAPSAAGLEQVQCEVFGEGLPGDPWVLPDPQGTGLVGWFITHMTSRNQPHDPMSLDQDTRKRQ